MKRSSWHSFVFILLAIICCEVKASAQTDTIRVMAYNVLNYGQYPLCQGANSIYHGYLKTIVQYTNPDILGLEKMGSIPTSPTDFHGNAPHGFGDSVLQYALNAAYPDRYAYCPFTNVSQADNMSVLFYDKNKFGFVAITSTYPNITDFNTYKLYYKDPALSTTHDTTFLYVVLNHDQSGSSNDNVRGGQIAGEMARISHHFMHLPNMINMGDFNTRSTLEPCYQTLTAPADTNFRFYDPPFFPDQHLTYPINWDSNPTSVAAYLTTSTRSSSIDPNTCGTSGGGKSWYDHLFISPWIVNNTNYIQYIPNSYRTIGNDGHRLGLSIKANTNASAPADVIEALFQMSNKYPVMVDLAISSNTTGNSPVDPEVVAQGVELINNTRYISMVNPVTNNIILHCSDNMSNQVIRVFCYDVYGRMQMNIEATANSTGVSIPCSFKTGVYFIKVCSHDQVLLNTTFVKE